MRVLSRLDLLLMQVETGLRHYHSATPTARPTPGAGRTEPHLSSREKQHIAGLMRVNHSGEVCAQALYFGQALLARNEAVRHHLLAAAQEEVDHLRWCKERIHELGSHTSPLNPLWYACSVLIGVWASLQGDAFSLGFIHATEAQVEQHIDHHLEQLPLNDDKTRDILLQMKEDEAAHGEHALTAGGKPFSDKHQRLMRKVSGVMTTLSYY